MAELLRIDPLPAYNFHVWLGILEFGFSKVSGLARESDPITYQEGGVNDHVHVLPGPTKNCGTIRLERGVYVGQILPLYLVGAKLDVPMRIEVWKQDNPLYGGKVFTLDGLVIKRWEVGDLDAQQNALLIDRFELSYEEMFAADGTPVQAEVAITIEGEDPDYTASTESAGKKLKAKQETSDQAADQVSKLCSWLFG